MNLKEKLESSLKESLRSSDEVQKNTFRLALSSIRMAEKDKGEQLDENAILSILQKEIKSRRESISDAQKAGRDDLVSGYQKEIALLQPFLPQPFSESELTALIQNAINEAEATTLADMGKVMKVILPRLQGRASNDQVSQLVRQLLQ